MVQCSGVFADLGHRPLDGSLPFGFVSSLVVNNELAEADLTMSWLERAYAARDPGMTTIKIDSDYIFLHDDPRFIALLEKMNLAD